MSDSTLFLATRVNCSVSDMEEKRRAELRGGADAMLDKTKEFFQTCDVEGKGYITRTDMRGFAFKRKEKVKHEYNKLLRKERRKNPEVKSQYRDEYPEHLKHLYMAEAEKLRTEVRTNRINRTKGRMAGRVEEEADHVELNDAPTGQSTSTDTQDAAVISVKTEEDDVISPDQTDSGSLAPAPAEADSLPMSNRSKKKMLRKTSYQKTKEEFENVIEQRANKKEEFLKIKQQKQEAIQKYKQKKMENFQMLSKKTKKGQPNLNLQMEYLLQKIQGESGK